MELLLALKADPTLENNCMLAYLWHCESNYFSSLFTVSFGEPWLQSAVGCGNNGDPAKSTKTKESTRYAVHMFREYLQARGRSSSFEGMAARDLNLCLADFFANVRSRNGEVYSKNSLMAIRQGLRRHLQSAPYFREFDIVTDSRFLEANNVIREAMRFSEFLRLKSSSPVNTVVLSDFNSLKMDGKLDNRTTELN